jgi:IS4 transposase
MDFTLELIYSSVEFQKEGVLKRPQKDFVTEVHVHEVNNGKLLNFPKGSIIVMDRGYNDYSWHKQLTDKGMFFDTLLKTNTEYRVVSRRSVLKSKSLSCDQTIEFTGAQTSKQCPTSLRRISYKDAVTGKRYIFLTNNFKLSAKAIADVYKARWQLESFFKWNKQNLKIKSFIGTGKNAVLTQIWFAKCVYLILALVKLQSILNKSIQQELRILQLNLFEKRDLMS